MAAPTISQIVDGIVAGLGSLKPATGTGVDASKYLRELRRYQTTDLMFRDRADETVQNIFEGGIAGRTPAMLVAFAGEKKIRGLLSRKFDEVEGRFIVFCCSDAMIDRPDERAHRVPPGIFGMLADAHRLASARSFGLEMSRLSYEQLILAVERDRMYAYGIEFSARYMRDNTKAQVFDLLTDITGLLLNAKVTIGGKLFAPTVAVFGASGSTTWSYKVVGESEDGARRTLASPVGSVANGAAVLSGGNFNRLTTPAISGAARYHWYRTTAGGTPSTLGKIGTTTVLTLDDTGLAGDGVLPLDPVTFPSNRHY